ncbi:histidine phosphatase family protein [Corynebacterium crudilactis]|uniref:Phosphoglycerate mutase n=1 Tax=Corynebacterium crudilactis TaxID=1652495 RepID=A0A172QSK2_9CORY|nr:histidine phosphatase family protein [Corynebacterium crudilactis]ANE03651.1 phosphoglycerate mutase [Corynebacterium crudilactis]
MTQAEEAQKSTIVLLIRHGQTPTTGQVLPGRTPGLHLSDQGHAQATDVSGRLAGLELAALYASPMERAQETAAPTSKSHNLEILTEQGLVECDFGQWTGQKLLDLNKLEEWKEVQKSPSTFRFPEGESFVEMQNRMVTTVEQLAHRHEGEVIAAFSHADTIKAAVAYFVGTPLDLFQKIHIDTASISAVEFQSTGTRMLVTNSRTGSLEYLRPQQ